ncbi:MAG: hypothetical protein AMJ69_11645 [Gammaproteobacteria bacterium SG8_47]|nr:MAG: hypothetical protein AMJ69_11645 [Gammaproteobacteria bacterium SG8_47]
MGTTSTSIDSTPSQQRLNEAEFLTAFRGGFVNMLRWHELDALWQRLRAGADEGWYVYAVGETPPRAPLARERFGQVLGEIDALLRREHQEDYCGIVYADDRNNPTLVKIYDPNNLGSSCGTGLMPPPLPGWVISRAVPADLKAAFPPPGNRRRWWQRLLGG